MLSRGCVSLCAVTLLDISDVRIVYGDGSRAVDIVTDVNALADITLTGTGVDDTISAVGANDDEVLPQTYGERLVASGFLGDKLIECDAVDRATSSVALILEATGMGLVIPARLRDPVNRGAATTAGLQRTIRTSLAWAQRIGTSVGEISGVTRLADGNVDRPAGTTVWAVLTAAGTIAGAAQGAGIRKIALAGSAGDSVAVSNARGWLLGGAERGSP